MVKTRLTWGIAFAALVGAALSPYSGPEDDVAPLDEASEWQRFSERCASDSLRTLPPAEEAMVQDSSPGPDSAPSLRSLSSAEADFRGCDRDWNRVNDFWTADVKGLYTVTPLIELSVDSAETDGPQEDPSKKTPRAKSD